MGGGRIFFISARKRPDIKVWIPELHEWEIPHLSPVYTPRPLDYSRPSSFYENFM